MLVDTIFCEMPCLTERSSLISGLSLRKKWFKGIDQQMIGHYLQKFIEYNQQQFTFLDIQPQIIGSDNNCGIVFRTSRFVGSIPLRAPHTGKQIGDFVIKPRYIGRNRFEEYVEVIELLQEEIPPEFIEGIPLLSGSHLKPPLYFDSVKFVQSLELLLLSSWRKFDSIEILSAEPSGQINWRKYMDYEHQVEKRLWFPIKRNCLSQNHQEYAEIRYAYDIARKILLSQNTPLKIKSSIRPKLLRIDERMHQHKPKITKRIKDKSSDSPIVKKCKMDANQVLGLGSKQSSSWRIDYAAVFEKFIQYVWREISKELGGKVNYNPVFLAKMGKKYPWGLQYLEPDLVFTKGNLVLYIDAKYKSNIFNHSDYSDILKEDHRRDIHQILAYMSFSDMSHKYGMLCYPSNSVVKSISVYKSDITKANNNVIIMGIPMNKTNISEIKKCIIEIVNSIDVDNKLSI